MLHYLIDLSAPGLSMTTAPTFSFLGIALGVTLFASFMAARILDGWPNHCSERWLTLPILGLRATLISIYLYFGMLVGFYTLYAAASLCGPHFPPFRKLYAWIKTTGERKGCIPFLMAF